ncbi:MAG: archaeosine biosynthesis radical SAM protein RaSEA [Methanobacteriota archaeon]|nr:MAG: archaeosine biosynthesis radical SAM protein RaSEA [Euryarchaeota archaeon]
MKKLEDYIPERWISDKGSVNEYISCWTEKDALDREVVDALVVILRTSGCSWAREKGCTMCGYLSDCNPNVKGKDLVAQMRKALEKHQGQRILKIFTSGSFLDEREVPVDVRREILSMASEIFDQVIFETRPEYVSDESLQDCLSHIPNLQVALGLESANNVLLRDSINKGFQFEDYQTAANTVKESGATLKTYLLIKPPFLTENEAITDSIDSARMIQGISDVISFNPVNVQKGTLVERLWRRGEYRPPWLWSVVKVLEESKDFGPRVVSVPSGGGKRGGAHNCFDCDGDILSSIEKFSLGLRGSIEDVHCDCKERWLDVLDLQGFTQSSVDLEKFYG